MRPVQPVGLGFSPLDEELALLPGSLTPRLQEALVRLSALLPSFAKARSELAYFTGVEVHPDTARRRTEAAGTLLVAHQTAEAEHILQQLPEPSVRPERLLFSVDGAMVPLVQGQWSEVRTLAIGEVQPARSGPDGVQIETSNISYFSRRCDSSSFSSLATGELHRRGLDGAQQVAAVVDGAEWCQSFIDLHYPEAVRILDFAHAAEYVTAIGQSDGPQGALLSAEELNKLYQLLKVEGPEKVIAQLRAVAAPHAQKRELTSKLSYLESRLPQMQYGQFVAQGWPIGSGMVESANKLVVEERLKGAGKRWAGENVNPLLALRNALCNERWEECWGVIEQSQRKQVAERRAQRRKQEAPLLAEPLPSQPAEAEPTPVPAVRPNLSEPVRKPPHPWRRAWSIRRQKQLANAA